ncbi:hypothetical protein Lesp02_31250 [Lentzea sp. NBRC 105346]|uniref:hypothetical protein n=1 Tax=Lentzea sp. NBRC 105346 TaxID=3032205 RepID=UPI0024A5B6D9|nr:hypothetical protein [Lentzea sp. NBRC 105346]GLZ30936.1 hypothetical protein Lesp02_31250 [Lentzea sp. NBRC 105346]
MAEAIAAARESPLCAESLPAASSVTVLAQERGPADSTEPNRLVEVRAVRSDHGWIAWAHLATSTNPKDRFWLDWSYLPNPAEKQHWRMCGPHPITSGPDSPAVKGVDDKGHRRWVRACGQPPPEDRPSGSQRSWFCTSCVPVEP